MGSYTITFTPDDASNASAMVRVDLGATGARITELTVRAGNGDGLVPGELPGFDLGQLMRAIAPAGPVAPAFELSAPATLASAAIAPYPAETVPATVTAPARKAAKRATARSAPAQQIPAQRGTAGRGTAGRGTAGRGTAGRGTAKPAVAKKAPAKPAAAKKAPAKATSGTGRIRKAATGGATAARSGATARATKRTGTATPATSGRAQGAGRAYRRTPTDIVEVFSQAPSATALARHYGVPRHTVQGWLRRLRSEGVLPPSSRTAA